LWGEKNNGFYNFQQKSLNRDDIINYRMNFKSFYIEVYIRKVMDKKYSGLVIIIFGAVGYAMGFLIFHKIFKKSL